MTWFPSLLFSSLVSLGCLAAGSSTAPATRELESIDQDIESMLRNDPQVRLAEANLEKARAELVAARYDATLRILEVQSKLRELMQRRELTRDQYSRTEKMVDAGTASSTELDKFRIDMVMIDGELQSVELRLQQMGRSLDTPDTTREEPRVDYIARPAVEAEMARALAAPVEFPNVSMALEDWLRAVRESAGFNLIVSDEIARLKIGNVLLGGGTAYSVGEAMQALADQHGLAFVQRDYGWILLSAKRAKEVTGAAIPRDLPCTSATRVASPQAGPSGPSKLGGPNRPTTPGGAVPPGGSGGR